MELDTESFDYIFDNYGMEHYGNLPLIEPLEYKEVNRLEELVIAIDTVSYTHLTAAAPLLKPFTPDHIV